MPAPLPSDGDPAELAALWDTVRLANQVIEISGNRIVGHHNFLDTRLFAAFGLPTALQP
jgi:hypothetical protein